MARRASSAARALLLTLSLALAATGCATNPATGRNQLSFFGEEAELDMGRGVAEEIDGAGALYDDPELAAYVEDIGQELAAASERPHLPWTFQILDDPTVNAFALPGGFIYLTRGILAHLDSEAELAAVLGHEIGHVTARHSVNQVSKQLLAMAGLGVAAILDEDIARWAPLGEVGLALMFLKHSRDDERQADDLGLRYLLRAGYDPHQMPEVFSMLGQVGGAEGPGLPAWLSTHPDPGARAQRIAGTVSQMQAEGQLPPATRIDREPYLERLAGLSFGPLPGELAEIGEAFDDEEEWRAIVPTGRIELARLDREMPVEEFARRYCSADVPLEVVALLNRLPPDGTFARGALAKGVVSLEAPRDDKGKGRVYEKGGG